MPATFPIPEGLRVCADGSWRVGDRPVLHQEGLRYLKARLVHDDQGDFVVDGTQRVPVVVEGPAFEVVALRIDDTRDEAWVFLDDRSAEALGDDALGMSETSGRFECRVRDGCFVALLGRGPHQTLLEHVEEDGGRFFLRAGRRRIRVRT
ncbi:MAG TPA: hypothetical protein VFQ51_08975 [Vicinamibacteria bacterium]|nr:hypothetical protein [Vicinamibacteria bacterium]